jgi:MFS family permease
MEHPMTACATCPHQPSRVLLSNTATSVVAVVAAMTFSASGAAPTPIYQIYQATLGLAPFTVTIIFAAYVLSLLLALLTVGSISDYTGRRPSILAALSLNVIAMIMFATAGSAIALIAARSVQGFATGLATTALGAAILDTSKTRGPILNSVTAFGGLTIGSLGAAAFVTFGPDPTQLVYLVLLATSALEALILWHMPETAEQKPGAFASLLPQLSVPVQARTALLMLTPVTIASWALGGFYFSLMPSLVRMATGATLPIVGGLVVAALTFSAAIAVLYSRTISTAQILPLGIPALAIGVAITLIGAHTQLVAVMLLGTIVSGGGFGAAFSATIRALMPLAKAHERAGLLSAFYVVGYVAFSLPAVLTGFSAPIIGLRLAADIYGTVVILLALASLVAANLFRHAATRPF